MDFPTLSSFKLPLDLPMGEVISNFSTQSISQAATSTFLSQTGQDDLWSKILYETKGIAVAGVSITGGYAALGALWGLGGIGLKAGAIAGGVLGAKVFLFSVAAVGVGEAINHLPLLWGEEKGSELYAGFLMDNLGPASKATIDRTDYWLAGGPLKGLRDFLSPA